MEENIWEMDLDEIQPQELTEKEKSIAKECSEIEMEFREVISLINSNYEEK